MRVKTPAIKLEVSLESAEIDDGDIKFEGMAGMMPCETHISPGRYGPWWDSVCAPKSSDF